MRNYSPSRKREIILLVIFTKKGIVHINTSNVPKGLPKIIQYPKDNNPSDWSLYNTIIQQPIRLPIQTLLLELVLLHSCLAFQLETKTTEKFTTLSLVTKIKKKCSELTKGKQTRPLVSLFIEVAVRLHIFMKIRARIRKIHPTRCWLQFNAYPKSSHL